MVISPERVKGVFTDTWEKIKPYAKQLGLYAIAFITLFGFGKLVWRKLTGGKHA